MVKPQSVRARVCRFGSYFGIKPAKLLSHGISGVQAAHYDRYEYINEKRNALVAWERRLQDISDGTKNSNVVALGKVA